MTGKKFSKTEAIKFGWETTTGNLGLLVSGWLVFLAVAMMPAVFTRSFVVMVVAWVFDLVVALGLLKMTLRFVDGGKGELVDLFSTIPLLVSFVISCALVFMITCLGFCLLVLPGIYWSVRLTMVPWVLVDKGVGPVEALKQSWEMTRGSFWNLVLFGLLLGLVNILGLIALGFGLLVTIPLSVVAKGYCYRRLEEATAT